MTVQKNWFLPEAMTMHMNGIYAGIQLRTDTCFTFASAVLHTVFSNDENGQNNVIDTPTQARKMERPMGKGYFKEDVIRTYLEKYHGLAVP